MPMRVLIVDDEPLARGKLKNLLAKEPDVEVVGEAGDGRGALDAIASLSPDLVFLDVQMPELDGFGVLAELPADARPAVVFVTAHDQFALKAFEVHALDYLLKPFDRERLVMALNRARQQLAAPTGQAELQNQLSALLAGMKPPARTAAPDRIAVKTSGRILFVNTTEIDWVEAADNYVKLHLGKVEHLMRETLSSIEQRLGGAGFVRISRSVIVHPRTVRELQPLFHGDQAVILKDGTRLTLSRTHRDALDKLVGGG
ncbi:MAG TPA: LytTR family DNA-binding domain-containing protein [Verrucomicrobiae bacterium]|nr:LytTR family DNA-binding domain-containing protein [Verrucomicrobiae bacterium]